MPQSVLEMAKDLVQAQIQTGQLLPENMQQALQQTYASLMALKAQEETGVVSPVQVPEAAADWRKSVSKHTETCLECGASFKQLSRRHLQEHDLDGRSYREKYGIPRTQALAARETTARRRKIVQEIKPWVKEDRTNKALFKPPPLPPASAAGRCPLAALAAPPARRSCLRKWLVARRGRQYAVWICPSGRVMLKPQAFPRASVSGRPGWEGGEAGHTGAYTSSGRFSH